MKIEKQYKIENCCGEEKRGLNKLFVEKIDGKDYALASDGFIAAKVQVELEDGELNRGDCIDANDFKFQRKNPKAKDEIFCCLEPAGLSKPGISKFFNRDDQPVITIGLNAKRLQKLAEALGNEKVKLTIYTDTTAVLVSPFDDSTAQGVIMPIRITD